MLSRLVFSIVFGTVILFLTCPFLNSHSMPARKESAIARPGEFGLPHRRPSLLPHRRFILGGQACCLFGDKGIILSDQAEVKRSKEVPN